MAACSLGGDTCTAEKPFGPRKRSHSSATSVQRHSKRCTNTAAGALALGPASVIGAESEPLPSNPLEGESSTPIESDPPADESGGPTDESIAAPSVGSSCAVAAGAQAKTRREHAKTACGHRPDV